MSAGNGPARVGSGGPGAAMIPYHGGPFSDSKIAAEIYRHHHAMVSFARPEQVELVAEHCRGFALDNGAFTRWKAAAGAALDWDEYYRWVERWKSHPGCDFALIPDVIDGTEQQNDDLLADWPFDDIGTPVYHMHESLERLDRLARSFGRVALGSSGKYRNPGSLLWWDRITQMMRLLVIENGYPKVKLHGLRMLSPELIKAIPFTSADSTTVARNVNLDTKWKGSMAPSSRLGRALALRERIEQAQTATRWQGPDGEQIGLFSSGPQLAPGQSLEEFCDLYGKFA